MATVGERKHSSHSFLSTNPFPSDFESLSNDRTAKLSTHSLPSLHIPWGGIPLVTTQQNEMDSRLLKSNKYYHGYLYLSHYFVLRNCMFKNNFPI